MRAPGRARPWQLSAAVCAAVVVSFVALMGSAFAVYGDAGTARTTMTAVDAISLGFAGVEAGDSYSLAWTGDGELFGWGRNDVGQLGTGSRGDPELLPVPVAIPSGQQVVSASAGIDMSVALTADGGVYVWGNSDITPNTDTPQRIPFFDGLGSRVVGVSAGGYYYLAWTENGRLYSWGNNGGGRLGRAGATYPPALVTAQGTNTRTVTTASAGRFQGVALFSGSIAPTAWGTGYNSSTGVAMTGIPAGTATGVAVGSGTVLIWTTAGTLYSATSSVATLVTIPEQVRGAAVSMPVSGAVSLYAWTTTGGLYSWGLNTVGQLGLGTTGGTVATPTPAPLVPGSAARLVAPGADHAIYLNDVGSIASAGGNAFGQLGTGDTSPRNTFDTAVPVERWP